jgi:hypothetical protein
MSTFSDIRIPKNIVSLVQNMLQLRLIQIMNETISILKLVKILKNDTMSVDSTNPYSEQIAIVVTLLLWVSIDFRMTWLFVSNESCIMWMKSSESEYARYWPSSLMAILTIYDDIDRRSCAFDISYLMISILSWYDTAIQALLLTFKMSREDKA